MKPAFVRFQLIAIVSLVSGSISVQAGPYWTPPPYRPPPPMPYRPPPTPYRPPPTPYRPPPTPYRAPPTQYRPAQTPYRPQLTPNRAPLPKPSQAPLQKSFNAAAKKQPSLPPKGSLTNKFNSAARPNFRTSNVKWNTGSAPAMRTAFRNATQKASAAQRQALQKLFTQRANSLKAARLKALQASKNKPPKPLAPAPKPPSPQRTEDVRDWTKTPTSVGASHVPEELKRSLKEQVQDGRLNTHSLAREFEKAKSQLVPIPSKVTPEEQDRIKKLLTTTFNKHSSQNSHSGPPPPTQPPPANDNLPDNLRRIAEINITNSGTTILGAHETHGGPDYDKGYIAIARSKGHSFFNIGEPAWKGIRNEAMKWETNKYFLNKIAEKRDVVKITVPASERSEWLQKEIDHLINEKGYIEVDEQTLNPRNR